MLFTLGRVNVTCPFCEMYLQTNSIYECRRHLETHIKELDDFLKSPQVRTQYFETCLTNTSL